MTLRQASKEGRKVLLGQGISHMAVKRFGQTTTMDLKLSFTETPAGRLLDFESELRQGAAPLRTSGQVRGDRLEMKTTTSGKVVPPRSPGRPTTPGSSAPKSRCCGSP